MDNRIKKAELKRNVDNYLLYGLISLVIFFPISIYFFVKRSQFQKELDVLEYQQ